jgi:general secretion pathway protein G
MPVRRPIADKVRMPLTPKPWKICELSLRESLAAVMILGIGAALIVPHISESRETLKDWVDRYNKTMIDSGAQRRHLDKHEWPAATYSSSGLPANPVDGTPYDLNVDTHRVN